MKRFCIEGIIREKDLFDGKHYLLSTSSGVEMAYIELLIIRFKKPTQFKFKSKVKYGKLTNESILELSNIQEEFELFSTTITTVDKEYTREILNKALKECL